MLSHSKSDLSKIANFCQKSASTLFQGFRFSLKWTQCVSLSRLHSGFSLFFCNLFRNRCFAWGSKCDSGHKRGIWRNHSRYFWWSFCPLWTYSRPASAAVCGCSKWGRLCSRSRRWKCIIHRLLTKHLQVFPHCARTKEIFCPWKHIFKLRNHRINLLIDFPVILLVHIYF